MSDIIILCLIPARVIEMIFPRCGRNSTITEICIETHSVPGILTGGP